MAQAAPPASRLGAIKRYLLPSERIVIQVRRHWAELFWPLVAVFGGVVIAMLLDTIMPLVGPVRIVLWLAWGAVLAYLVWRLIEWSLDWFVVTDRRFLHVEGVFTRKVGMMPLARVTDMGYERSLLGRVLGYGMFVLESAGQDQALDKIDFLPNPDQLYREVSDLLFNQQRG
jgi:uncharacterized membrane protein YdbT with pleckstrin-like domain